MFKLYLNCLIKIFIFLMHTNVCGDQIDFEYDDWSRQCYLYKPSCIPEEIPEDFEGVPLVFMLHGIGGEGADWYGLSDLAEDSCFVAAFPQGMYDTWNAGEGYGHNIDDVSYLEALLDTIYYHYPIDSNKVYVQGWSMGGFMASHLNCTSNRFTAFASGGGGMNPVYGQGNSLYDSCNDLDNDFNNPILFNHGMLDEVVPIEWPIFALYHWINATGCNTSIHLNDFVLPGIPDIGIGYYDSEFLDFFIPHVLSSGDTISYTETLEIYEWSNGCHSEPSVMAVLLPQDTHWFGTIDGNLTSWNFFRQFSKDKLGPSLDSLLIMDNDEIINLNDNYDGTDIRILAMDNYAVSQMIISFSGLINIEGFDITINFDSNTDNLIHIDTTIILNTNIPSDNYEIIQINLLDFNNNQKIYDIDQLQNLGLYQQIEIVNTLSTELIEMSPNKYLLRQNYPNPFNPVTTIEYIIPEENFVFIKVFDIKGKDIKTLVNRNQNPGQYSIKWDMKNNQGIFVPAGIYFYSIQTLNYKETKKMLILK